MLCGCHIRSEDYAQYELFDSCVCSRKIIYLFLVLQVSGPVENYNIEIFSDTINVISVKLCRSFKYIKQAMNIPLLFLSLYSREIIDVLPDLTKKLYRWLFSRTLFKQGISNFVL